MSMRNWMQSAGKIVVAAAALAATGLAQGQALTARIGTSGAGLEVGVGIGSHFGVRANVLGGSISHDEVDSGIRYDGKFKLSNGSLLLDLHPFAGSFRVSAGIAYNNNRMDASAVPQDGFIEINQVRYPAASVGRLDAAVRWDRASPYVGIGFGMRPAGAAGFFLSTDIGAFFQRPAVSLMGTCGPALPALVCQQLQADVRAEEAQLRNDFEDVNWYPVLAVGIGYRF